MSCSAECNSAFSFIAGETQLLVFHLRDDSGDPYDATGCKSSFAISGYINQTSPLLTKAAEINSDLVKVELSASDTLGILPSKYIYQLTIMDPGGNVEVPAQGFVIIRGNIDLPFISKE